MRNKTLSTRLGLIHNVSDVQLSIWVYDAWHFHAKGQYFGEVTEAFCKNGHHKLSVPQQHSAHSVNMVKEILNKHVYGPESFPCSSLLMTMLPFSLLEEDNSFSITDPLSGFRFCVINDVSAPKLPSLVSVTCQMDTRKAHTVPYNELCHFWHPVCTHFSVIQLVTDNSVHYPGNVYLSGNISSRTCLYAMHHL